MAATLTLDWHELLWLLQGGMSGSHLRWSVYEDFVNKVYPQLDDEERENIYTIAKRDLSWHFEGAFVDETPHQYFEQLLARFDPEKQRAVTLRVPSEAMYNEILRSNPSYAIFEKNDKWRGDTTTITVHAYCWEDKYYIDWSHYCDPASIKEVKKR